VRGRHAIGVGLIERGLKAAFRADALGLNVKSRARSGDRHAPSESVSATSLAPHPNACKTSVNWVVLVDRGGEAAPIGRWGLAENDRLFALWHRFRAGEFDRKELRRRLIPLPARLGRVLRREQENPDRKAAALCRELTKWWAALWTFARVESMEPTNNAAERALRPAVLWRKGSFVSDSEAGVTESVWSERWKSSRETCTLAVASPRQQEVSRWRGV
jgi:hypothetical protein